MATVHARATRLSGLLARVAAAVSPHPLEALSYETQPDGSAQLALQLPGGVEDWHTRRVVAKLGRIVGVTTVTVAADDA